MSANECIFTTISKLENNHLRHPRQCLITSQTGTRPLAKSIQIEIGPFPTPENRMATPYRLFSPAVLLSNSEIPATKV